MGNDETWQFLEDPNRKIERAARDALQQLGRSDTIVSTRLGVRRHAGQIDPRCDELWCVRLSGSPTEVRECLAVNDGNQEMVAKLVASFKKL